MKKTVSLILVLLMLCGAASGLPLLSPTGASAQDAQEVLRVHADGTFRILQIADLQDCYIPKDGNLSEVNVLFREINTVLLAIGRVQPDLIVLTGDNIQNAKGTMTDSTTAFEYSVRKITACFGDIPFIVAFGNHDQESNSRDKGGSDRLSEAEQAAIYEKYGALPLQSDIVPGDTSENATAKYGTGYVDIYDAAGETVVQRVILINSGTYDVSRNPSQYGRTGVNAVSYTDEYDDYAKVVAAVERWTADPAIKCVAFQHIPLQEIYYGDADETSLLVHSENGQKSPNTCEGSGISGKYAASSANPTLTGEYNEYSGCSYSVTRELFNALADKPNVVGLFFGHDHHNTLTGRVTVDGKSLVLGWGGGLLVDPSIYPHCDVYAHNPLVSAYTLTGNGLNVQDFTDVKRLYTYYGLLRDYDIADFSTEDTYISDVRLFAADTPGMPNYPDSYVGYFEEAKAKCVAAGYTPLETCYTRNSPGSASYSTTADFNFGCYKYQAFYSGAKAVCLGYKTTDDPTKAITDIRIYDGSDAPPAKWTKQEIWAYQNNSMKTGSRRSTANNTDDSIPFYNANYDFNEDHTVYTLRTDTNAQIRFCEGLTTLGTANNAWLYYTKDPHAGTPIKSIFVDITDTQAFSGSFNLNRFNTEYPYAFAQNLNGTYDFDRDNAAFNVRMGYAGDFTGGEYAAAKGSWAYIGLVHAVETHTHEPAVVPEDPTEPSTDPVTEPSTEPVTEPLTDPVTQPYTDPVIEPRPEGCSHLCHSSNGLMKVIWKIVNFFNKLFKINKTCSCGEAHW